VDGALRHFETPDISDLSYVNAPDGSRFAAAAIIFNMFEGE
jgi:hypothetical protein